MVKKRNRNPLVDNYRDAMNKRYQTSTHSLLEGQYALHAPSHAQREDKSITMSEVRGTRSHRGIISPVSINAVELSADPENIKKVPNIYQARRQGIYYLYKLYGSPPKDVWQESNIVPLIMNKMDIPHQSFRLVVNVLDNIVEQESVADFVGFDATSNQKLKEDGRSSLNQDLSLTSKDGHL